MNAFKAELPDDPRSIPRSRKPTLPSVEEEKEARRVMEEAMRSSVVSVKVRA